jgi:hypothetical protein
VVEGGADGAFFVSEVRLHDRGVVVDQVPDRRGKVWPGIEQLREHAVVFAQVMRGQG